MQAPGLCTSIVLPVFWTALVLIEGQQDNVQGTWINAKLVPIQSILLGLRRCCVADHNLCGLDERAKLSHNFIQLCHLVLAGLGLFACKTTVHFSPRRGGRTCFSRALW